MARGEEGLRVAGRGLREERGYRKVDTRVGPHWITVQGEGAFQYPLLADDEQGAGRAAAVQGAEGVEDLVGVGVHGGEGRGCRGGRGGQPWWSAILAVGVLY